MPTIGAGGNRKPTVMSEIEELKSEIRKLWMAVGRNDAIESPSEIVFSYSGPLSGITGTVTSGPWTAFQPLDLTGCILGFETSSGSSTTVTLLISGEAVATATIPAGSLLSDVTLEGVHINKGERLQVRIPSGGGSHLTVNIRSKFDLNRTSAGNH